MYKELIYLILLVNTYSAQVVNNDGTGSAKGCIMPPPPDHGKYNVNVQNGVPGVAYNNLQINVTCDQGYELEGLQTVSCFSGWWPNPIPKCVSSTNNSNQRSMCTLPPYPIHGTYITNIRNARPGVAYNFVSVNVTCDQGYTLDGPSAISCFNGWWTEKMPECTSSPVALSTLNNRNTCILPQYPSHGNYTTKFPGAKPGESYDIVVVNITCDDGYVLNGPPLVYCSSGQWTTDIPQCVLPCRLMPHASVTYRCIVTVQGVDVYRDCNEYEPSGTLAKPFCRKHYYPTNTLTVMECHNGRWKNNFQKCTADCGILTPNSKELILNGSVVKLGEVPWHAAIYRKTMGLHDLVCGGSLVSTSIVISAAHCFWNDLLGQLPASDFIVAVGKFYRRYDSKMEDATYKPQWSNVESVKLPEHFRGRLTNFQDDIAVVQLSTAIEYRLHIRPVCVDFDPRFEKAQLLPGNKGKVGTTNFGIGIPYFGKTKILNIKKDKEFSE